MSKKKPRKSMQFPNDLNGDRNCPALLSSNQDSSELPIPNLATDSEPSGVVTSAAMNGFRDKKLSCGSVSSEGEDDEEEKSGDWSSWKAEDGATIACICFICDYETTGYDAADLMKAHIESNHKFSFEKLKNVFKLSYSTFIQFVRWAREQKRDGIIDQSLRKIWSISPKKAPWLKEDYALPTKESNAQDFFLTLAYFPVDDSSAVKPGSSDGALVEQIHRLESDQALMISVFQRLMLGKKDEKMGAECGKLCEDLAQDDPFDMNLRRAEANIPDTPPSQPRRTSAQQTSTKKGKKTTHQVSKELQKHRLNPAASGSNVGKGSDNNKMYFDSYNEIAIHHEMIFDIPRTKAYRAAIEEQRDNIRGKVVMDIGCGSGILSMFCAEHSPKAVYAIDKSEIIYDAMSNAFENNLSSIIKFIHKDVDTDLLECVEKVDVIVSEFMGYFLFFEGMTETFVKAREMFLKPGGVLLPDKCSVFVAPLGSDGIYQKMVGCWNNAFGYKMPALQARVLKETHIESVFPSDVIGDPVQIKHLDLLTCKVEDCCIEEEFNLVFNQDANFSALAGYFSADFTGVKNKVVLSTSPWDPATHWKQAIFFLPKPVAVKKGQSLSCSFSSHPNSENPRWLVVTIEVAGFKKTYQFN